MVKGKSYKYNKETLCYEEVTVRLNKRFLKFMGHFVFTIIMAFAYFYIYSEVLDLKTPKYLNLIDRSSELKSKLELLEVDLSNRQNSLFAIKLRDNNLYRPLFGMDEIPTDVRLAGYGGIDNYSEFDHYDNGPLMKSANKYVDKLYSMAYVQSKSLDDIVLMTRRAGKMASSIPTISPVNMDICRYTSAFGMRKDPWTGIYRPHRGIDLAGKTGTPIYVTGAGVVVRITNSLFSGYGRSVIIDHGFGYKTRYAHLHKINVVYNQELKRGDIIGEMGNTGRSKGTHLHYEVIYKNKTVNPLNYFSLEITLDEYLAMGEGQS